MKAERRYVAQNFFHVRTLPGPACQEGQNRKTVLKCAVSSHEYARSAYPLGDVVELEEERYWPTWAFIEPQNGCESIETSKVRTSRIFMRKASKNSIRMLLSGPLFVAAWVVQRFTQLDVAWNGASRTVKFQEGRPAGGIPDGVSWEVANEFRRNAS